METLHYLDGNVACVEPSVKDGVLRRFWESVVGIVPTFTKSEDNPKEAIPRMIIRLEILFAPDVAP